MSGVPDRKDGNLSIAEGTRIGDYYIVQRCLGRGSNSVVYKCRNELTPDIPVVLKILSSTIASDQTAIARFYQEFVASSQVVHPHVLRTYDFIYTETSVAFVTEYASGGDLAQFLCRRKRLSAPHAIQIALEVCAGLQAIHNAKIIHRDLKPENIFFGSDGRVKVADLGIARIENGRNLTAHGSILGTVQYISPEYISTGSVDSRSDLYALGLIIYEMISGVLPFQNANPLEGLTERVLHLPPPPRHFRDDCPQNLEDIIMKAIAISPELRFQTAAELANALEAARPKPDLLNPVSQTGTVTGTYIHGPVVEQPGIVSSIVESFEDLQSSLKKVLRGYYLRKTFLPFLMALTFALSALTALAIIELSRDEQVPAPETTAEITRPEAEPINREQLLDMLTGNKSIDSVEDQTIKVVDSTVSEPLPELAPLLEYTVRPGDTIKTIGRRFNVLPHHIVKMNQLEESDDLIPGTVLIVPK